MAQKLVQKSLEEDAELLAHEMKEKVLQQAHGLFVVGIAGMPGAGKSTLSAKVVQLLSEKWGIDAQVVPMDGYHFYKKELDQFADPEQAHYRRGAPFTFNVEKFLVDLRAMKANPDTTHSFPGWDHSVGDPLENAIIVDPKRHKVVFVEGNYLLLKEPEPWPELKPLFDETWFLSIDVETAVQRVAKRNAEAFGWPLEKTMARVRGSDELNMRQVLASEPEKIADRVIILS